MSPADPRARLDRYVLAGPDPAEQEAKRVGDRSGRAALDAGMGPLLVPAVVGTVAEGVMTMAGGELACELRPGRLKSCSTACSFCCSALILSPSSVLSASGASDKRSLATERFCSISRCNSTKASWSRCELMRFKSASKNGFWSLLLNLSTCSCFEQMASHAWICCASVLSSVLRTIATNAILMTIFCHICSPQLNN